MPVLRLVLRLSHEVTDSGNNLAATWPYKKRKTKKQVEKPMLLGYLSASASVNCSVDGEVLTQGLSAPISSYHLSFSHPPL